MSLNMTITSGNEETVGCGWSIVTAVQKRKYRMVCYAAIKDAELVYKWACTLFKICKRRMAECTLVGLNPVGRNAWSENSSSL